MEYVVSVTDPNDIHCPSDLVVYNFVGEMLGNCARLTAPERR